MFEHSPQILASKEKATSTTIYTPARTEPALGSARVGSAGLRSARAGNGLGARWCIYIILLSRPELNPTFDVIIASNASSVC